MEPARWVSISLLLACMLGVAAVRMLPRSLAGVAAPAAERARTDVANELKQRSTGHDPAAVERWIADHPAEYAKKVAAHEAKLRALFSFTGGDGREHPYLADYDSYFWLRLARNELSTGDVCDEITDGICRDTFTHAPVGRDMIYDRSLHVDAIVWLHRLIAAFSPGFPLSSSSFFVPVIVGVLGVIPAFLLGKRFGGLPGAVTAALVSALNPTFLTRSIGSDNDVWNVIVMLFAFWALVEALHAAEVRRRVLFSIVTAAFVTLHSAIWSGWLISHIVVAGGMVATLVYAGLRAIVQRRSPRVWGDSRVRAILTVAVVYAVGVVIMTWVTDAEPDFVEAHRRVIVGQLLPGRRPAEFNPDQALWPSEFRSVAEVRKFRGGDVTLFTTNVPLLMLSFVGVTLLALGPLPWGRPQWATAGVAVLAIGYVYTAATPDYQSARLLLFAPIGAGLLAALLADRERDPLERGGLVVAVCLAVAYTLGTASTRFVMFFAAAVGVSAAPLAGWLYRSLTELLPRRVGRGGAVAAGVAAVAALLAYPLHRGYVTARDLLPQMDDAWWQAFADIRDNAPPDAVVNLWWDDGHWAKYISERRVTADGASLKSHILFWFTRALLADDEKHAVGLLRMLNCGSDALPFVEGKYGAYSKLRAAGLTVFAAVALIDRLAILDRAGAQQLLTARGLTAGVAADVLESTHCTLPPLYLVVSDRLAITAGWGGGHWDFRRAYAVERAAQLPREQALHELTETAGFSAAEARQLYREAGALRTREEKDQFIAPELGYLTKNWVACEPDDGGTNLCRLNATVRGGRQSLDAVQYPQHSPASARLRLRKQEPGGEPSYSFRTPGRILIAADDAFVSVKVVSATDPNLAVLIDVPGRRILMAEAALLASAYTKLQFLDGRYLTHFEKVGEYSSMKHRIVTYRIRP
jgi:hypothetical protein